MLRCIIFRTTRASLLLVNIQRVGDTTQKSGEAFADWQQYSTRVITSGDTPTISSRAPGYSKIQRPIMCGADRGE